MKDNINNNLDIRNYNKKKILKYLIDHDCTTKKTLSIKVDLSFATVSNLSNQLIESGFIMIDSYQKSEGGRNASLLSINDSNCYIAVRILSKSSIEVGVVTLRKQIIFSEVINSEVSFDAQEFVAACSKGVLACKEQLGKNSDNIIGVGVALPGIVEKDTEKLMNSTIPELEGQPIIKMLEDELKYPVFGENESNLLALAIAVNSDDSELLADSIYLHMDDGLGIGIVCNGKLLKGSHAMGSEINHMPIGTRNRTCYCGQKSCVETELSLPGFVESYESIIGNETTWEDFCSNLLNNQEEATIVANETGRLLGKLISILDSIFDPVNIYIGGRAVSIFDQLYPTLKDEYRVRLSAVKEKELIISPCINYEKLMLIGCADLVFDKWNP